MTRILLPVLFLIVLGGCLSAVAEKSYQVSSKWLNPKCAGPPESIIVEASPFASCEPQVCKQDGIESTKIDCVLDPQTVLVAYSTVEKVQYAVKTTDDFYQCSSHGSTFNYHAHHKCNEGTNSHVFCSDNAPILASNCDDKCSKCSSQTVADQCWQCVTVVNGQLKVPVTLQPASPQHVISPETKQPHELEPPSVNGLKSLFKLHPQKAHQDPSKPLLLESSTFAKMKPLVDVPILADSVDRPASVHKPYDEEDVEEDEEDVAPKVSTRATATVFTGPISSLTGEIQVVSDVANAKTCEVASTSDGVTFILNTGFAATTTSGDQLCCTNRGVQDAVSVLQSGAPSCSRTLCTGTTVSTGDFVQTSTTGDGANEPCLPLSNCFTLGSFNVNAESISVFSGPALTSELVLTSTSSSSRTLFVQVTKFGVTSISPAFSVTAGSTTYACQQIGQSVGAVANPDGCQISSGCSTRELLPIDGFIYNPTTTAFFAAGVCFGPCYSA